MAKPIQDKKSNNRLAIKSFNWLLIPLVFIIGVIPLIMRYRHYETLLSEEPFFDFTEYMIDFFTKARSQYFIGVCVILAILTIYQLIKQGKKVNFSVIFIPLAVYEILSLLSSIFSVYQPIPFSGVYNHQESIWVLLGYFVTAYYVYLVVNTSRDVNILVGALTFSTVVLVLIGFSQTFFKDFFTTEVGLRFILPSDIYSLPEHASFSPSNGTVYLTLFNSNHVGSYVTLVLPIFILLIFAAKKVWMKVAFGLISLGLAVVLLASHARGGFIGVVFSLLVLILVFNKQIFKKWIPLLAGFVVMVVLVIGMNTYSGGTIANMAKDAVTVSEREYKLSSIETLDDRVRIVYDGNILNITYIYDPANNFCQFLLFDGNMGLLPLYIPDSDKPDDLKIMDERFSSFTLQSINVLEDMPGFKLTIDGYDWLFTNYQNSYYFRTQYGKLVKIEQGEYVDSLRKYGHLLSDRAYIWAYTLPLLKDHILLGSGPDTFMYEWPNCDFVALYNGGFVDMFMTKPHNMYLQIAVQTGLLSMIAILVFFGMYFISSLKLYIGQKEHSSLSYIGIGLLGGASGYLMSSFIYDSCVAVSPLFWALIGLGIAVNRIVKKEICDGIEK